MTLVLRSTGKLAKLLGEHPCPLEVRPDRNEWYANLVWIDRRKCILFTHAETLFSFLVPDVLKAQIVPFPRFFATWLHLELERESLPSDTFGAIDPDDAVVAKTADRSVLGSMNELAYLSEVFILRDGGMEDFHPHELNPYLRRVPMGALKYAYPIERTMERLAPTV